MSSDPIVKFVEDLGVTAKTPEKTKKKDKDKDERAPKRLLWHWRLELLTLAIPFILFAVFGPAILVIAGITVVAMALADALPTRLYRHHSVRRHVHNAFRDTGALDPAPHRSDRKPLRVSIRKVEDTNVGERLALRLSGGGNLGDLEGREEAIAKNISTRRRPVAAVKFHRNQKDAARPHMQITRADPFDIAGPSLWPLLDAQETSVWDGLPYAYDDKGHHVIVETMGEGHILIGGATRAGKSGGLNLFVAQAALDPLSHNIGFDNQEVELAPWKPALGHFVGGNMNDAIATMKATQAIMERIARELTASGRRKVTRGDAVRNLFIDELAYYLMHPQHGQEFERLLLDILQRGAKCGIRVVACTQRPSATILNTNLRAQFTHRIAYRTKEAETTQMILGNRNAPAHEIPSHHKGVFYLETDSDAPIRARTHWLTEDHVRTIAARAAKNTQQDLDKELDKLTNPPPKPPSPPKVLRRVRRSWLRSWVWTRWWWRRACRGCGRRTRLSGGWLILIGSRRGSIRGCIGFPAVTTRGWMRGCWNPRISWFRAETNRGG
jgi:S-DNA-T family DNA segregation ATPase FtsK/SpoIIIE